MAASTREPLHTAVWSHAGAGSPRVHTAEGSGTGWSLMEKRKREGNFRAFQRGTRARRSFRVITRTRAGGEEGTRVPKRSILYRPPTRADPKTAAAH